MSEWIDWRFRVYEGLDKQNEMACIRLWGAVRIHTKALLDWETERACVRVRTDLDAAVLHRQHVQVPHGLG